MAPRSEAPPAEPTVLSAVLPLAALGCLGLLVGLVALALGGVFGYLAFAPGGAATPAVPPPSPSAAPPTLSAPTVTPLLVVFTPIPTEWFAPTPEPTTTPSPPPTAAFTPAPAGTPTGAGGGRIAFISDRGGQGYQVFTLQVDGGDVRALTHDAAPKWDPAWTFDGTQLAWSPDGAQLVYVAPGEGGGTDLWLIDVAQAEQGAAQPQNLTAAAGDDFQPAWCADGTLWFASTRVNGVHQIFYTTLARVGAGQGPVNVSATHNSPREYDPALFPGCQRLLLVSPLGGAVEIWRYFLDCPDCYAVVRSARAEGGEAVEPALAPDGDTLVYTVRTGTATDLVLGSLTARIADRPLTATGADRQAQWSPDGQWLAFTSERDGNAEIYLAAPDPEARQTNLTGDPANDFSPAWEP